MAERTSSSDLFGESGSLLRTDSSSPPAYESLGHGERRPAWQGPSTALRVQFGEKVGEHWYAPRLQIPPYDTGFAALNMCDRTVRYEGFEIPARQLALVAQPYETMSTRLHFAQAGTYFVVVSFRALTFEENCTVAVSANGRRLWESRLAGAGEGAAFPGCLNVAAGSFVDLAINAEKAGQTAVNRCTVRFAVFRCDRATGDPVERLDNYVSDLSRDEIKQLYENRGPCPMPVPAAAFGLQERAAMLEAEWRLPAQYMSVGFNRSAGELARLIETNEGETQIKYCIFMVGRSGSTLLSEILAASGALGFPQEYFIPEVVRAFSLCYADRFGSSARSWIGFKNLTEQAVASRRLGCSSAPQHFHRRLSFRSKRSAR